MLLEMSWQYIKKAQTIKVWAHNPIVITKGLIQELSRITIGVRPATIRSTTVRIVWIARVCCNRGSNFSNSEYHVNHLLSA